MTTANERYQELIGQARAEAVMIEARLAKMGNAKSSDIDYGHVGDMSYVLGQLQEVWGFLQGDAK